MASKWIQGIKMKKGALTATAKAQGKTPAELCASKDLKGKTAKRCALRKTLMSFKGKGGPGGPIVDWTGGGETASAIKEGAKSLITRKPYQGPSGAAVGEDLIDLAGTAATGALAGGLFKGYKTLKALKTAKAAAPVVAPVVKKVAKKAAAKASVAMHPELAAKIAKAAEKRNIVRNVVGAAKIVAGGSKKVGGKVLKGVVGAARGAYQGAKAAI